ncbi:macrophage mannose receptor 1-like [Cyclopterus lumpus]|uniref:macrophage mannose receptor 1-like n=1 Tax=Cyclopterus lumpus TaxID=8103 RepID=UPI001486EAAF|nr:macrophage mannose receptor 1-like [Cyclopterus lumpus]
MDKLLLSVVVVSGLCAVSSAAGRHYHVVHELKTMSEAQRHCRENYKDLVTIRDLEDLETLKTLKRPVHSRAWIGLYHYLDNWRWSLPNTSYYKPGETEFRRWKSGQPNNLKNQQHCTLMQNTNALWNDIMCEKSYKSVCFDVRGPNRFVLISTAMNWTEAQSYCREHHTDLALVRNMEENQMVQSLDPSGGIVWIGLFRDPWKWSDGSDSSFRNWNPPEPRGLNGSSETCVAADFSADGRWETLDCNVKSAFICYSDVPVSKRVVKVRLEKRSSSLDLNDPVVMEDLLKQLKQRLKDQGLNDDIKLSWKKQSDGKVFHKEEKKT